jgi:transposase InsO family protein
MENTTTSKIKTLHSDNGGEYIAFKHFLAKNGIKQQFSCPHTHEQNGIIMSLINLRFLLNVSNVMEGVSFCLINPLPFFMKKE